MIHFKQGPKWYLCNKETIFQNRKKFKYILRQEHYDKDFINIYNLFCKIKDMKDKDINYFLDTKRNNTDIYNNDKKISDIAINNLKIFFREDYEIFDILVNYNIITKEYMNNFI